MDFFLVQQPLFKCARRDSNPRHLASESADGITFAADGKATVTVEQFELNL